MAEPRKDGIDELWQRVDADSWQEALELGVLCTAPTEFRCPNGVTITMGFGLIKLAEPKNG
jgi:hypothetical protein